MLSPAALRSTIFRATDKFLFREREGVIHNLDLICVAVQCLIIRIGAAWLLAFLRPNSLLRREVAGDV
jgi:hypothetical protein